MRELKDWRDDRRVFIYVTFGSFAYLSFLAYLVTM